MINKHNIPLLIRIVLFIGNLIFKTSLKLKHIFQRKLDGYEFPVYSTEYCPRNETEWKERSTAINCSDKNGYVCLPNDNITELLEFCYTIPFIWIEEGKQHKLPLSHCFQ